MGSRYAETLKAFDREWLDHAIYHAGEDEIVQTPSPKDQLSHIIGHHDTDQHTAAIVVLGEADYCIRLVDAGAFPHIESGRVPREDQIFMMRQRDIYTTQRRECWWEREYEAITPQRPPLSAVDLPPLHRKIWKQTNPLRRAESDRGVWTR